MDLTLLFALGALILVILLGIVVFLKFSNKDEDKRQQPQRPVPNRIRDNAPRRAQMARNRGARLRANAAQAQQHSSDDEADEPLNRPIDVDLPEGKIGAKKKAKLEAKAEKRAQREVEEQLRAERKKKQELVEEERRKIEERERLEAEQRAEEERKAKEEKERQEYEEYLKMKEAFAVEEEGYEETVEGNEMNLLQEFVKFIKDNKVVVIEDLAARFKLKTQAAIDRIKDLQNDNILTGVIDDRGKFIFVSEDEMEAVAKFIRQRGRVSVVELAENSNKLINFAPLGSVN